MRAFESLFYRIYDSQVDPGDSAVMEYYFKYFHRDTPYVPLMSLANDEVSSPLCAKLMYGSMPYSNTYKGFMKDMLRWKNCYMKKYSTRGNYYYLLGPGIMYNLASRHSHHLIPMIVTVVPSPILDDETSLKDVVMYQKDYIEVFLHNDIRSVNSTAWKYVRKHYIPLLQDERIRFTFKSPNTIMDLTTVDYQKPKFTSFEEMNNFNQRINEAGSLRNALPVE